MTRNDSVAGDMPRYPTAETDAKKADYPELDFHGIQEVFRSGSNWKRKVFWVGILILSAIAGAISCYHVTKEYNKSTKATKMELKQVNSLMFPKITICSPSADAFDATSVEAYFRKTYPNATKADVQRFVTYMIAGSGFQKFGGRLLAPIVRKNETFEIVKNTYEKLRGSMSVIDYFYYFNNNYGLQCKHLLVKCSIGGVDTDCCALFEPSYHIRRGRCLSLKPGLKQISADELGQLTLMMKETPKYVKGDVTTLIVFVQDFLEDIAPFPRYHLRPKYFNKFRLVARRIVLINDSPNKCGPTVYGKGTCYQKQTLAKTLHNNFGCMFPYWPKADMTLPACHPLLVVNNYDKTVNGERSAEPDAAPCILPCERWEYRTTWEDREADKPFDGYDFLLDIAFTDLQYEEIREIKTVSFWGFVSQIGGQLGFFLGSSIISIFQLALFTLLFIKRHTFDGMLEERSDVKDISAGHQTTSEAAINGHHRPPTPYEGTDDPNGPDAVPQQAPRLF